MTKSCTLCKQAARIHCESDQASLCWDCDAKVHSANFLVARHSRNLLCRVCQSPTPWSASGSKLDPTFSNCRQCVNRTSCCKKEKEEEAEEEQDAVENQIAQWSPLPPPSTASESSVSVGEAVNGAEASAPVTKKRRNDYLANGDRDIVEGRGSKSAKFKAVRRFHGASGEEIEDFLTRSDGGGGGAIDLNLSLGFSSR